ncbi:MAG: Mur ligase family protein, partial [Bacteroidota bacterium]
KGSTASLLAAIATASGQRTGLHTSPHLVDLAERMRLDGQPAPHAWVADAVARYRPLLDDVRPSYFEATVALTLLFFAEMEVDLAVVEVGLGGRLDATNVLTPEAALVTYIGLDHTNLLGPTKAAIAYEKAGIAKPGVPFLTAELDPAVRAVLQTEAEAREATFEAVRDTVTVDAHRASDGTMRLDVTTPVRRYDTLTMGLSGAHQAWNAALAIRAAEVVETKHGASVLVGAAAHQGISEVRKLAGIRGRCEVWSESPLTVLDVSHNADGIAAALAFMQAQQRAGSAHAPASLFVVLGLMQDKDLDALVPLFQRAEATVVPVLLDSPRARSASDLRSALAAAGLALSPDDAPTDPAAALAWLRQSGAPHAAVLAAGSHLVVASILHAAGA